MLPPLLATHAQSAWEAIAQSAGDEVSQRLLELVHSANASAHLAKVLACSPYVAQQFRQKPQLLLEHLESGSLYATLNKADMVAQLKQCLDEPGADTDAHTIELAVGLRRYRQRQMTRIVWRDFCRLADTQETIRDTSFLAEVCIAEAAQRIQLELEERFGVPRSGKNSEAQKLIVLAMGKLGARELNLSSDVDLIFAYPQSGSTVGTDQSITNEEFFIKVGQGIISALDPVTAEGFVFRVDMRLRPYGDSGALVHNFNALEDYYQDQGRDWERYAMIKARPITGDPEQSQILMETLRPFVYRRYIDFGVIESLRSMKKMIATEVRRRGLHADVKLGHGGIREVEFIAQCFQLIRGGRDIGLQQRELIPVLAQCEALECLPPEAVVELRDAYHFLRDTEHGIQGYQDKQTQQLPQDEYPQLALAIVMGFASWSEFLARLQAHRDRVAQHFRDLIAEPEPTADVDESDDSLLWGEELTETSLAQVGFREPTKSLEVLRELRSNGRVVTLQAEGSARLEQFMPQLLRSCAEVENPDLALARVLPIVLAVVRRSAYLALLLENPAALVDLVRLCSASPWISQEMAKRPVLLDEFLDRGSLYTAPDKKLMQDELRQQVARLAPDDLESQMDALRYFKSSHVLRVAASELAERLPLMKVSDNLTWIAEVILEQVLAVAWFDLCQKYGEPERDSKEQGSGFAIYAFGKLGGIELGYGSDLDLVFIYDAKRGGVTNGERSIDSAVFYTRLGQRIIHILETRMVMGQLYEVDMRLRPSGESGMLVTTVDAFRHYQTNTAWTWEHQALVRARFVAGDSDVAQKVDAVRADVLCQPREEAELVREVQGMRDKMREHLLPQEAPEKGEFHLKQDRGGIVDIEFMVQYAVLAWSHRSPELVRWSDNVRILETLAQEGFFEQQECDALRSAYLAYRSAAHQLALQQKPGLVPAQDFDAARSAVLAKWEQLFAAQE